MVNHNREFARTPYFFRVKNILYYGKTLFNIEWRKIYDYVVYSVGSTGIGVGGNGRRVRCSVGSANCNSGDLRNLPADQSYLLSKEEVMIQRGRSFTRSSFFRDINRPLYETNKGGI